MDWMCESQFEIIPCNAQMFELLEFLKARPDAVNRNHFHRIFCGYWIAIAVNACYILRMESIQ
jgi:hypothetical protein